MVYAYTQDASPRSRIPRHAESGGEPLASTGLLHLSASGATIGGLRYIDVWESEDRTRASRRIHSAVEAAFGGARPATEPR
jgi:hypothetical protein